jgi:hypothetical protein
MAIESHVKRIHINSYDHLRIRIRKCPISIGILDTHITRKITAPLRRAVPRGPYRAMPWGLCMRGGCVSRAWFVRISSRGNLYWQGP